MYSVFAISTNSSRVSCQFSSVQSAHKYVPAGIIFKAIEGRLQLNRGNNSDNEGGSGKGGGRGSANRVF